VVTRPPRGPVNRRAIGSSLTELSRLSTSGRISGLIGTTRARLPFVPLSVTPPGLGVVWRRTFQVQVWRLMSARRTPDVSPMRAAVHAVKPNVRPSRVATVRAGDQGGAELLERVPVRQCEQARVVELVFGLLVFALPSGDASPVEFHDAVAAGLLENTNQDGQAVLHRGPAGLVGSPGVDGAVHGTMRDHPDGQVAEGGYDSLPPPGEVRIKGLGLQSAQCQVHHRLAVGGEVHRGGPGVDARQAELL
jgi:hypothetical protein